MEAINNIFPDAINFKFAIESSISCFYSPFISFTMYSFTFKGHSQYFTLFFLTLSAYWQHFWCDSIKFSFNIGSCFPKIHFWLLRTLLLSNWRISNDFSKKRKRKSEVSIRFRNVMETVFCFSHDAFWLNDSKCLSNLSKFLWTNFRTFSFALQNEFDQKLNENLCSIEFLKKK